MRAGVYCGGYRDVRALRQVFETPTTIKTKVLAKEEHIPDLHPVILSLDARARDIFLNYYVDGVSRTWQFLLPFFDSVGSPEHLTTTIDAVSLAFLSHQVSSTITLESAREKYASALHKTAKALKKPDLGSTNSLILSTLLLDLFEKLTNPAPSDVDSYTGHVNGALALVQIRGLEKFQDAAAASILVRLGTNLLISCCASGTRIPSWLTTLRSHAAKFLNPQDPKWQLSSLMCEYANLRADVLEGILTLDTCITYTEELDDKLAALIAKMPPSWQYKTTKTEEPSDLVYENRYDTYPDRHTTQTWNVIRLIRITLNELFVTVNESHPPAQDAVNRARTTIESMAAEICYSGPQFMDCFGAAQSKLSVPAGVSMEGEHRRCSPSHSPAHGLDCYSLIFPFYAAGRTPYAPAATKAWVVDNLRYMGSHFGIKNAETVRHIIVERGDEVCLWTIYAMLGSYAFAA